MTKIMTVSVLGPTASGKTGCAIELARLIGGEVVSCDSMQLYRGMNIGTATPDMSERGGVPHHMLDTLDLSESFSAADYRKAAAEVIGEISSRGKIPILCGGTGMYYDSLMKISSYSENLQDDALRLELSEYAHTHGNEALHGKLMAIDPEAAEAIHPNNVKRVIRAIEIYETSGKRKSDVDREQTSGEIPYDDKLFIIEYKDREKLYGRIDNRVDYMFENGLENEARAVFADFDLLSLTARQAIGYKEFIPYFSGEKTLDEVKYDIKLATRHYAKRQMIWMRRYKNACRIIPDNSGGISDSKTLAESIAAALEK